MTYGRTSLSILDGEIKEKEDRYNELRLKSYNDLEDNDDFLTWLLIKLNMIQSGTLKKHNDGTFAVANTMVQSLIDKRKQGFEQEYKKYIGKDAPDISNGFTQNVLDEIKEGILLKENRKNKYNEIAAKSYENLGENDDFITWLLVKLDIIEPEDLNENDVIKGDSLKNISDKKKDEFKRKYEEYTIKKAPDDISNLKEEDKKRMKREVYSCERKNDEYLQNLVKKIVKCRLNKETREVRRLTNKLEITLLPALYGKYESYIKTIQVMMNNTKITVGEALSQVKSYNKPQKPTKPSFYVFKLFSKEGRMYRKNKKRYKDFEIADSEKEKAIKLMKSGYHGTPQEIMKRINERIGLLGKDEANNNQKAILTDIGIKACAIYEEEFNKYKVINGVKPDLIKQTEIFEKCFAIAATESGKMKKVDTGLKALNNSIKMSNASCRASYRTYTAAVGVIAKANARNIITNNYNKQINLISKNFAEGKITAEETNKKRKEINEMMDEYKKNSKRYKKNVNRYNNLEAEIVKNKKNIKDKAKSAEYMVKSSFRWTNRLKLKEEAAEAKKEFGLTEPF